MIKENKCQKVQLGMMIGGQLGLLEYLFNDSEEAELEQIDRVKKYIKYMVSDDNIIVDMTSYESIVLSVIEGYREVDEEVYSYILMGICAERYLVSKLYDKTLKGKMMEALAESTIKEIPKSIIKDVGELYKIIKLLCEEKTPIKTMGGVIAEWMTKNNMLNSKANEKGYVFISYSSKNQEYAEAMRALLIEEKIKSWMAPYDIPAGTQYAYVINDAIEKCNCVLLLLSEQSQLSLYVEKEIERAIAYRKTVIPMHIDESSLNSGFKYYIGNEQIVPVREIDKKNEEIKKILNGISVLTENID